MRGRKPNTERMKLLAESSHRVIGGTNAPAPPEWLAGDALTEWNRVVPDLASRYLATAADTMILAAYCEAYALWRKAQIELACNELTFVAENGTIRVHPLVKIVQQSYAEMRRYAAEFGFSPAARSRIDVGKPGSEEDADFDEGSDPLDSEQVG